MSNLFQGSVFVRCLRVHGEDCNSAISELADREH